MPKATNIILLHIRQNCIPGSSNREAVVKVSSLKIPTTRSIIIGIRGASWAPKVQSASSSEVNDHQRVQWIFNLTQRSAQHAPTGYVGYTWAYKFQVSEATNPSRVCVDSSHYPSVVRVVGVHWQRMRPPAAYRVKVQEWNEGVWQYILCNQTKACFAFEY